MESHELISQLKADSIDIKETAIGREHTVYYRNHILLPYQKPEQQKIRGFPHHIHPQFVSHLQQPDKENHTHKNHLLHDLSHPWNGNYNTY